MDSSREVAPDLYRRYLALFLDGIHADRAGFSVLPATPLSARQTHQAVTRGRQGRSATSASPPAAHQRTANQMPGGG